MMSRTHVAMGIATSLLVMHPQNTEECFVSLIGGALGGIVCDVDTVKNDYKNDAHIGQYLGFGIPIIVLLLDYFLKTGICEKVISSCFPAIIVGSVLFVALYIVGYFCDHRSFTHSFLALGLMTVAIGMIHKPIAISFAIGFVCHLLLDSINKKELRLLFPIKKGICFRLCYAGKLANKIFLFIGIVSSVFLLVNALFIHLF